MTKLEEAQTFLAIALAQGARSGDDVTREATANGIDLKTLMRARENLRITTRKLGNSWVWELPARR